jgi:chemotaxis signal transduction protein
MDRALVFESQGLLYGITLALVSQVVPAGEGFCPLPGRPGPVAGLYPHGQALYPIYSTAALLGTGQPMKEPFFVLTELAGQSVGLTAARVLGVQGPFTATSEVGQFRAQGLSGNVHFLDFQRMFC